MTRPLFVALACVAGLAACGRSAAPADFDPAVDACARCRMVGSDGRTAAELAAPGEEPRFFDDVACLRDYLKDAPALAPETVAYVVDHRTRSWLRAVDAVYVENPRLTTPMGSHLAAHASSESREADRDMQGTPLTASDVFAGIVVPNGGR